MIMTAYLSLLNSRREDVFIAYVVKTSKKSLHAI
jgi:hypothetical protein